MKLDFSNVTTAVSGTMTTEKAVLLFFKPSDGYIRVSNESADKKDEAVKALGGAKKALGNVMKFLDDAEDVLGGNAEEVFSSNAKEVKETKEALQKIEKKVTEIEKETKDSHNELPAEGNPDYGKQKGKEKAFPVTFQFNPAALRISAYGGGMAPMTVYRDQNGGKAGNQAKSGGDQVDYGPIDETVTVSFKVVFDAVRNAQAFISDRANPAPTNLGRQGADLIRSAAGMVRPVVEGFLAAVRNSRTRRVIFQWGDLRYGGYLNKVQCRYTMFDIAGEPVRAEVDLSLVCSCHDDCDNKELWRRRYNALVAGKDSYFGQKAGRLKSAYNAVMGNVEKACILFRADTRNPEGESRPAAQNPDAGCLSDMAARLVKQGNGVVNQGAGEETVDLNQIVKDAKYVPVRIHYNPSSVTISSRGGETVTREGNTAMSSETGRFQRNAMPTETVLFMELFFDDTHPSNAFMLDHGAGSPTGMVKAGIDLNAKRKGREYSVATISELFVAAVTSADTRPVCVFWNKMVFWGELCEVEVEYTMFNNRGNPIRSKVSIRIRQDGDPKKNGSYEEIWQKAYAGFPKAAKDLVSNKSLTGSSGNFIASNLFRM